MRPKRNKGDLITSESDRLLRRLFEYSAIKRNEGVYDFTEVVDGFSKMLDAEYEGPRNNSASRFLKIIKRYVQTDPRSQSRINEFS